jgi:hypothetical protein
VTLFIIGLWPRLITDDMNKTLQDNFTSIDSSIESASTGEAFDPILEIVQMTEPSAK